jgi:nitronate monooxygenase
MTSVSKLPGQLRLPVIGAPMYIMSGPELVLAQCRGGVIGSFPALNARAENELDEWLHRITEELAAWDKDHPDQPAAPFAVNQVVHKTNARLERDVEICARWKVPLTITSLGGREDVNRAIHAHGGIVLHDVTSNWFAHKAIEKGADGLIAVAAGAGGHAGAISPFALVQEIRAWFDGPLVLSGAIASGGSLLAAMAMGADYAYVGTAFLATEEARSSRPYKQMIVDSSASDILYTDFFSGMRGNYLKPSIIAAGLDPDALGEGGRTSLSVKSVNEAPKAWRDIWGCGQGLGAIDSIVTVEALLDRLEREFSAARLAFDRRLQSLCPVRV